MSTFRDYLTETGALPEDAVLGYICPFTISDERVKHEDAVDWCIELGLSDHLVPPPTKPVDAFKKATTTVDSHSYDLGNGRIAHLMSREVDSNSTAIVRQVTREIQDGTRRRLAYGRAIECIYERPRMLRGAAVPGTEKVRFVLDLNEIEASEIAEMRAVHQAMLYAYDDYVAHLDGMKLRQFVRNYLRFLNATEIKGGLYFVHANRVADLRALQQMVARFGGMCRLDLIPLVSLPETQQWVIDVYRQEHADAMSTVAKEAADLLTSRKKITPSALAKVQERYDREVRKAEEYIRTLNLDRDQIEATAEVARVQLDALVDAALDSVGGTGR